MIRLSKLSDYAVVVLSQLARDKGRLVSASGLAESTGIPEPTVSKVLKVLVKGNIIISTRGAQGGYTLERSPTEITVRELIEALEGPIAVTSCLDVNDSDCGITNICPMKGRWNKVNRAIMDTLDAMKLNELLLIEPSPKGRGQGEGLQPKNLTSIARDLRTNQTDAEKLFWSKVRDHRFLDLKFKRQEKIGGFIADFICHEARLIVELDGGQHSDEADRERTQVLESFGFITKRYWNNEVLENIDGVLTDLASILQPSPMGRGQGEGMQIMQLISKAGNTLTPTLSLQGEGVKQGLSLEGEGVKEGALNG